MSKLITVVHCWSAPRSRSTALLYSFEARGEDQCVALDEPLYREWLLAKGDDVARPYLKEMIEGIPPLEITVETKEDGDNTEDDREEWRWRRELSSLNERIAEGVKTLRQKNNNPSNNNNNFGGVIFAKHMAKHEFLYDFDNEFKLDDDDDNTDDVEIIHRHLLLIRDPCAVLSSWGVSGGVHGENPTSDEVGIVPLLSIYSKLESRMDGIQPVVLDSDELVNDPEDALFSVCERLQIPFTKSMLTWPAGKHKCDGPWAQWWYHNVWKSDGWNIKSSEKYYPETKRYRTLDPLLMPALKAAFPAYMFLSQHTTSYLQRGPSPEKIYEDPRNENLLLWIGAPGRGQLLPRDFAGVSPFDSSVQGGDACWEGIRVYRGKILSLDKHLKRLFKSAKSLGFENVHTKEQVTEAIFSTLAANGMRDHAHMRLTLTRGEKYTSSMNPKFNVYGTTLIIIAEWKPTEGATTYDNTNGISLISASQRRNPPATCDSKIHHNNLINNILPKIQANLASVEDALILDMDGFVSETNATNIFMVDDDGVLLTPQADHCLPGITRGTCIEIAKELGIPVDVRRISLAEFHSAEEVFTTGTMGELTPVTRIDGRVIGEGIRGPITQRLQEAYKSLPDRPGWATEIPPFSTT
mmetsp:Transcript_46597/g.113511  ORF Transcript_46597/g.113511 Transcript_46597/m.113511 type:complete len:638 (-) Transcript_46597:309-2222(-)